MRPKISERSSVSTVMPERSSNLFAVAHGVEGRGARADRADAQLPQAVDDAADGGEPARSSRNSASRATRCAAWSASTECRTAEIVAGRHLAAEAVAAVADGHLVAARRARPEPAPARRGRPAQRVGDAALVAEVRQRDDDAVDLVAMLAEQVGALLRVVVCFHRAVFGVFGDSAITLDARPFRGPRSSLRGPLFARWSGKKPRLPTITPNVICFVINSLVRR